MINEVADRYSEGLFLLAKESNDISNKKKQALGLLKVFEETPDLALFFKAVKVSAEEKKALICKVFGNKIDEDLLHFLELLVDKDRMGYVQEILREYVRKIKNNPIARKVKLADLYHNSDPNRMENPTPKDLERKEKYRKAIEILKY